MGTVYTLTLNIGALLITLGYPLAKVIQLGDFKKGVFLTWKALILLGLLWGIVIPCILVAIDPHTEDFVMNTFPEFGGLLFLLCLLLGWFPGLIVSSVGMLIRTLFVKSCKQDKRIKEQIAKTHSKMQK
jgi:hypothetical protein